MFDEMNNQAGEPPTPQEAQWQGWTPPWMGQEQGQGQGPRGPFGFRGFGGPQGWQGPRGPFGHMHGHHHGGPGRHGPFGFGFGPGRFWGAPEELLALHAQAAEVARLFAIASRGAFESKERQSQLRALLDRTQKDLSDMIFGASQGQAGQAQATQAQAERNAPEVEQA